MNHHIILEKEQNEGILIFLFFLVLFYSLYVENSLRIWKFNLYYIYFNDYVCDLGFIF